MTNFEAISARLYPYNVDDNLIAVACEDAGLDAEVEYRSQTDKISVAKATIDILKQASDTMSISCVSVFIRLLRIMV